VTRTPLIVDDHEEFRRFARTPLEAEGFDVAGEAADGESALEAVAALHPDAVLLDVQLPGIDGIEVARRRAQSVDAPQVVLTSTREPSDLGRRVTDAPARGFVPKRQLSSAVVEALLSGAST
jgi:DNA-binding NarL/FixJ family response regulator